ncbi:MAG: sugar ABC transporter permease [Lachnospiraceae bacterium]|jgi:arabinogalactan oligomer/maltooligosaccharide transport system permease protein|nr:sugar ABC transporter permease [Lachnospiraceae bacterium]
MSKIKNFYRYLNTTIVMIFLCAITFLVIYPLVYTVSGALSPGRTMATLNIVPFANGITFEHYTYLFTTTPYWSWFRNTFVIAISTSAMTILVASMGAYVFSRFRFPVKKQMLMALLVLQIFPSFVGMVAIYVILLRIGGLDTLWGLVLIYVAGNVPYNVWLVKSYMDTIPRALDEAARIDGASHFRTFSTIILPVAKPIITFLAIVSFTAPWMDFIFPKLVLRSADKQTLAIGLFNFVTDRKNEFSNFTAGALLVAIPFVIFFIITQNILVTSMSGSAVKE